MPTYSYECDACGHKFDKFQAMSDEVLTKCPECKKKKLRRLFGTGAGLIFKGSGFYLTDYRSEGYKSSEAADKKASEPAAESSKSDSGGDKTASKPAASDKPAASEKPAKSENSSPKTKKKD